MQKNTCHQTWVLAIIILFSFINMPVYAVTYFTQEGGELRGCHQGGTAANRFNCPETSSFAEVWNVIEEPSPKQFKYVIKAVNWPSVTGKTIDACNNALDWANKSGTSATCSATLTCFASTNEKFSFIKAESLSDLDIRNSFISLIGVRNPSFVNANNCVSPPWDKPVFKALPMIMIQATAMVYREGTPGGLATPVSWFSYINLPNQHISEDTPDAQCNVVQKSLNIHFGNLPASEVNGAKLAENLEISCSNGDGYAQINIPDYNESQGLVLRPDNSLIARVSIGLSGSEVPANIASSYRVQSNTTESIPVNVTLQSTSELKGGIFNASAVIHINFI